MKISKFVLGILILVLNWNALAAKYQYACKVSWPSEGNNPAIELCYQYESDYNLAQNPPGNNAEWVIKCENKANSPALKSNTCPNQNTVAAWCEYSASITVLAQPFQQIVLPSGVRTAKYDEIPFSLKEYAYNDSARKIVVDSCNPENSSLLGGFTIDRKLMPEKLRAQVNFQRIGKKTISNLPIEKDLCSQAYLSGGISCYKKIDYKVDKYYQAKKMDCMTAASKGIKEVCKRNFSKEQFNKYWDYFDKKFGSGDNIFRTWVRD
jgi:hypothetical protein